MKGREHWSRLKNMLHEWRSDIVCIRKLKWSLSIRGLLELYGKPICGLGAFGSIGLGKECYRIVMCNTGMSMLCKEEEANEDFSRNCKFHKSLDSCGLFLEFKVP